MKQLRDKDVCSKVYHEEVKFDKDFKYAERKNIPNAKIIASKELEGKKLCDKKLK